MFIATIAAIIVLVIGVPLILIILRVPKAPR